MVLEHKTRYLQIAFNKDFDHARSILHSIPKIDRILLEAGTPFIKREGSRGISYIASVWKGKVVADKRQWTGHRRK